MVFMHGGRVQQQLLIQPCIVLLHRYWQPTVNIKLSTPPVDNASLQSHPPLVVMYSERRFLVKRWRGSRFGGTVHSIGGQAAQQVQILTCIDTRSVSLLPMEEYLQV